MSESLQQILSVHDLSVTYGDRKVLDQINFDVVKGETLGIVGASGSGKSVTALALLRLLDYEKNARVVSGSVMLRVDNKTISIYDLNREEMRSIRGREIGIIFQEPLTALNPVMSVGSQIAEALRDRRKKSKGEVKSDVMALMDKVHISRSAERYKAYPHQLSGGMRQRIMIAMALAAEPRVLIADEPTTALDVTVQRQILAIIDELKQTQGLTIVFITHDMGVIAQIADRTMVMDQGRVIEIGSTIALFDNPKTEYAKKLIDAVPKLKLIP